MRTERRRPGSHHKGDAGMTLVEVLVVLAIIAVAGSASVLSLVPRADDVTAAAAQHLAAALQTAADRSLATGKAATLVMDGNGYTLGAVRTALPSTISIAASGSTMRVGLGGDAFAVIVGRGDNRWTVAFDGVEAAATPGRPAVKAALNAAENPGAKPAANDTGFSLIEALVAMALLAVAATGLLQATARHVDVVAAIEARAAAGWAADNALTEARLGLPVGPETLLGRRWSPRVTSGVSDDPSIVALTATVRGGGIEAVVRGFAARPAITAVAAAPRGARFGTFPPTGTPALVASR